MTQTPSRKLVRTTRGPRVLEARISQPVPSTLPTVEDWALRNSYALALFEAKHPSELPQVEEPPALAALPHYHGFAVGFMFCRSDEGVPDFKSIDYRRVDECAKHRLCGLCGQKMGDVFTIVGGPLTMQNRVSTDPPFHRECARFALQVCPFLLGKEYAKSSQEKHRSDGMALHYDPALAPPPFVNALLDATTYRQFVPTVAQGGNGHSKLFEISPWIKVEWFRRIPRKTSS